METVRATGGMVTAPHHLAAEAGASVLRDGGNAIEAMIAAAAAIAVVYPHMNALGGDGFWLIHRPGRAPAGIDACGAAGATVTPALYNGMAAIPARGPLAANTVAGTVSGWQAALELAAAEGGALSRERLLADAIRHAGDGFAMSGNQARTTAAKRDELAGVPGFAELYLDDNGAAPAEGTTYRNARLADSLARLAADGFDSFYRGALAADISDDLADAGCAVTGDDLASHRARLVTPLSLKTKAGTLFNMPPPTQGVAALMILGQFERLKVTEGETFAHIHGLVEATKRAFLLRDAHLCDPAHMRADPAAWLAPGHLDRLAGRIDAARAMPWPAPPSAGDTVWLGAVDRDGRAVSFIQSVYWEFGSGVVLPRTGIVWQNRGSSFSLDEAAPTALAPGRFPFHTLNPALAHLADGRVMAYGTMGGEGQPQTQAALFTRHVLFGQDLQQAVTAPRWLLGRTWGAETATLKIEDRFDPALADRLRNAGHEVEMVAGFSDLMGHAGAVVYGADGAMAGAGDPRSDGAVAAA